MYCIVLCCIVLYGNGIGICIGLVFVLYWFGICIVLDSIVLYCTALHCMYGCMYVCMDGCMHACMHVCIMYVSICVLCAVFVCVCALIQLLLGKSWACKHWKFQNNYFVIFLHFCCIFFAFGFVILDLCCHFLSFFVISLSFLCHFLSFVCHFIVILGTGKWRKNIV